MRTYISYLAVSVGCLFLCQSCNLASQTKIDEELETSKIIKVIEEETRCFFLRDYDCWQNQFTHTDYSYQAWSNSDGTFDASVGWDAIEKNLGKYIKENPSDPEEAGSSHPIVKRENIKVKFYGNAAAHLTWDQYNSDRSQQYFLHSKEVRLMEKVGEDWKIVNVSAFWNYKNRIPITDV